MKTIITYIITLYSLFFFSNIINAHVTVRNLSNGVDSISGKSDNFNLNVPSNRKKPFNQVRLIIPEDVKLLYVMPVPGWTWETKLFDSGPQSGNISELIYKGKAQAGEFIRFPFIALNPSKADTFVSYKAYVTYDDGIVVPFDGSEESHGYMPRILLK